MGIPRCALSRFERQAWFHQFQISFHDKITYTTKLPIAPLHGAATRTNSTNNNSTTGSKLLVNYQISTDTTSINNNSTTGSELIVNYQISANTNSTNYYSTTGSKLPDLY